MSSDSSIDEKKKHKKKQSSTSDPLNTDAVTQTVNEAFEFGALMYTQMMYLGFTILVGSIVLYTSKISQTGLMPTDINCEPFVHSDELYNVDDKGENLGKKTIVNFDVAFRTNENGVKEEQSIKVHFPYLKNKKHIEGGLIGIGFLKDWISGPLSSPASLYMATVQQKLIVNFASNLNLVCSVFHQCLPESVIFFVGPYLYMFVIFVLGIVNIIYGSFIYLYDLGLLFAERVTCEKIEMVDADGNPICEGGTDVPSTPVAAPVAAPDAAPDVKGDAAKVIPGAGLPGTGLPGAAKVIPGADALTNGVTVTGLPNTDALLKMPNPEAEAQGAAQGAANNAVKGIGKVFIGGQSGGANCPTGKKPKTETRVLWQKRDGSRMKHWVWTLVIYGIAISGFIYIFLMAMPVLSVLSICRVILLPLMFEGNVNNPDGKGRYEPDTANPSVGKLQHYNFFSCFINAIKYNRNIIMFIISYYIIIDASASLGGSGAAFAVISCLIVYWFYPEVYQKPKLDDSRFTLGYAPYTTATRTCTPTPIEPDPKDDVKNKSPFEMQIYAAGKCGLPAPSKEISYFGQLFSILMEPDTSSEASAPTAEPEVKAEVEASAPPLVKADADVKTGGKKIKR
jgi:hypothetical protein